jgi:hypothetical protein
MMSQESPQLLMNLCFQNVLAPLRIVTFIVAQHRGGVGRGGGWVDGWMGSDS